MSSARAAEILRACGVQPGADYMNVPFAARYKLIEASYAEAFRPSGTRRSRAHQFLARLNRALTAETPRCGHARNGRYNVPVICACGNLV